MHHTCAYRNAAVTTAVETDIAALTDDYLTIQNGHFILQDSRPLLYAWAGSASISYARIITPKFRQVTTPYIRPVNNALAPVDITPVADYRKSPLIVNGLEELQVNLLQASGGNAEVDIILGIDYGQQPVVNGEIYTLRGTGTTTQTADAWSNVTITWQDTLPAGRYAIVGLEAWAATCIAARLNLESSGPRPGCVGGATAAIRQNEMFRRGGLGVWGYFIQTRMPIVQVLSTSADTAQEVYLDIIRMP